MKQETDRGNKDREKYTQGKERQTDTHTHRHASQSQRSLKCCQERLDDTVNMSPVDQ